MMRLPRSLCALVACFLSVQHVSAIDVNFQSQDSIKSAAKAIAAGAMQYYHGNQPGGTPGLIDAPYSWWEGGALFGTLMEYWYYTGDDSYNQMIIDGMMFQLGDDNDFRPKNQTATEGNDDQVFWAFAAMNAAEMNFPNPPSNKPQWLALAQAIFNEQANRWNTVGMADCNGGLRWQIQPYAPGYNYKNTPSNAGLFQLAARLAMYTHNGTYAEWANRVYDWMAGSPLIGQNYKVNDGTSTPNGCADADQRDWTYNYGQIISGCAYMWNYTQGQDIWAQRLDGYVNGSIANIFPPWADPQKRYLAEACEQTQQCNFDQPSFKAYTIRWFATALQLAPHMTSRILPILTTAGAGAAAQCSGPADATGNPICGRRWYESTYDGQKGVGEQMSALSAIGANLITVSRPLVGSTTGGTSQGDPSAGTGATGATSYVTVVTAADRAGAGILTALMVIGTVGGGLWMVL